MYVVTSTGEFHIYEIIEPYDKLGELPKAAAGENVGYNWITLSSKKDKCMVSLSDETLMIVNISDKTDP